MRLLLDEYLTTRLIGFVALRTTSALELTLLTPIRVYIDGVILKVMIAPDPVRLQRME